jgi:hypothetical protein
MPVTIESFTQNPLQPVMYPELARTLAGLFGANLTIAKGTVIAKKTADSKLYAKAIPNQVQTITPTTAAGAGHYTIEVARTDGSRGYTGPLAHSANIATIQTALDLASGVVNGIVAAGAGALLSGPNAVTLTYSGGAYANKIWPLARVILGGDITNTTVVTVADTTAYDGTQVAVGICVYDIKTDANGLVYFSDSSAVASASNPQNQSAPIFIAGIFDPNDLTGWDSQAATDLGARTIVGGNVLIPM